MFVASIAAGTALAGALIAAITAGRRQKRQLAHDRRMRDLEEVRGVLDEAAQATAETTGAYLEACRFYVRYGTIGAREHDERVDEARRRLTLLLQRLVVRLGEAHEVPQSFHQFYNRATEASERLTADRDAYEERESISDEALRALREARLDFLAKASAAAGARLDDP